MTEGEHYSLTQEFITPYTPEQNLIDYDPGATGRDQLTFLTPSVSARIPLSRSAKVGLGLDLSVDWEIELEAQYYPDRAQLLTLLESMFPSAFGSAAGAAETAGAAEAVTGEAAGAEALEGGAAVAEGGLAGTLATIGAVILGFGMLFSSDSGNAEGARMAQQLGIYEYGLEFADAVTGTVGPGHDPTPSAAVREARARARADAARLTAAQRRQLANSASHHALALAASRVQAERLGTTFAAGWFD